MIGYIFLLCLLNLMIGGMVCYCIYPYDSNLEKESGGIWGILHLFFWPIVVIRFFWAKF